MSTLSKEIDSAIDNLIQRVATDIDMLLEEQSRETADAREQLRAAILADREAAVEAATREPTEDEIVEAHIAAWWKTGTIATKETWLDDECTSDEDRRRLREFARTLFANRGAQ